MLPPPPMAGSHAATSTVGPGDAHAHPPGHSDWQNQQNWSQQHLPPPQGAVAAMQPLSASPGYQQPGAHGTSVPLPANGVFMRGSHLPEALAHSTGGHAPQRGAAGHLQAARSEPVDGAATLSDQPWIEPAAATASGSDSAHVAVLPVDFPVPPGFDILANIQGPDNSYIAHIEQEAGVSIEVVGNSGHPHATCPVSVRVVSREPWKRKAAIDLLQSLLETVQVAADTWAGPTGHDVAVSGAPERGHQHPPIQHSGARLPLPQFQDTNVGPPTSYAVHRDGQHTSYAQPAGPPHGAHMQQRQHMPTPGFVAPDRQMHREPPPMMHAAPHMNRQQQLPPPGLNNNYVEDTRLPPPDSAPRSAPQQPQNGAAAAGGYYSKARADAAQQQPQEKPVKRKFREFKEEGSISQAPQEKTEVCNRHTAAENQAAPHAASGL